MAIAPGFFSVLLVACAKAAAKVATVIANRRAAQGLMEWDARALKDIGLTKGDVVGAMSLPFHRDPTDFLAHVAAGRSGTRLNGAGAAKSSPKAAIRTERLGDLPSAEPVLCA